MLEKLDSLCHRYGQWPAAVVGIEDAQEGIDFAEACALAGIYAAERYRGTPAPSSNPKTAPMTVDLRKGVVQGRAEVIRPDTATEAMLDRLWPPTNPPIA